MATPTTVWQITELAHPDECPECLGCARSALTTARCTGSVGATYSVSGTDESIAHSATVSRIRTPLLISIGGTTDDLYVRNVINRTF